MATFPSGLQLTPGGIQKLLRLTGNFQRTDVIVQILPRVCQTHVEEHNATVSDGSQLLPAVLDVRRTKEQMDDMFFGVYRIKVALLCLFQSEDQGFCNTLVIASFEKCTDPVKGIFGKPWKEASIYKGERIYPENVIPIAAVPFIFPHYTRIPCIRALVTFKSRLHHPPHGQRSPSPFVIHLMDESSEVWTKATGRIVVEEVYHRLQIGKAYYFHDLLYTGSFMTGSYFFNLRDKSQLSLTKETVIEEVSSIKPLQYRFRFIPISRLKEMKLNTELYFLNDPSKRKKLNRSVDTMGIVKKVSLISEGSFYESSVRLLFREITIFDQSGTDLLVRLWSYNAEDFAARPGDIVAFRNAHLLEYPVPLKEDGKSSSSKDSEPIIPYRVLSVVTPSTVHLEPEVEERFALRRWYDSAPPSTTGTGSGLCEQGFDNLKKGLAILYEGQI